jgi:replicative DNA helicase
MELYNRDIEAAILSTFIYDNEAFESSTLDADDFFTPEHNGLFKAMQKVRQKHGVIDEHLLKDEFKDENVLLEIMATSALANFTVYEDVLRKLTAKRKLIDIQKTLGSINDTEVSESVGSIQELLHEVTQKAETTETKTLTQTIIEDENKPPRPKYETGTIIDIYLDGGVDDNQLIFLGGEKGAGKTALALQTLFNVSAGFQSAIFSFEMPGWKLGRRAKKAGIQRRSTDNITMIEDGRDIATVIAEIRKLHKTGGKFFVIDSLMKLRCRYLKNSSRNEQLSYITNALSELTQQLDIVIYLIVQVSKEDQKSGTFGVKGSGDADYDADIMINIKKDKKVEAKRKLVCEKNRQNGNEFVAEAYIDKSTISLTSDYMAAAEIEYTPNTAEMEGVI